MGLFKMSKLDVLFVVHPGFFGQQGVFLLYVFGIGYAAVHGTYRRTLRLFMEAHALGTLIGNYIVEFVRYGDLFFFATHYGAVAEIDFVEARAIAPSPFHAAFIDGSVGAFWFAGTAVDAFIGDHYSHARRIVYICSAFTYWNQQI